MDECLLLLRGAAIGRLGFVHHGEPEVLPINFGMDGASPVFRSTWGNKLDTASVGGLVALEVDDVNLQTRRAWSVVIKGQAEMEYSDAAIARYEALGVPAWLQDDAETFWVRVLPESVTGRELDLP
jgi:nitroimidazol reductase NimA-like FMN-containing flavoprotein (pyridoxamine 5'-phosphate oxidase superfamily)